MDSNNFPGSAGVGEREARVYSALVLRRHHGMAHGIGRSGNITEDQPKASSTLMAKLCNLLAQDALTTAGFGDIGSVTVLPVATGMAITLCLLALKQLRPAPRYVLWPRIDQKTCIKCVAAAGLELLVVPNIIEGDQLRTDLARVEAELTRVGAENSRELCKLITAAWRRGRVDAVVQSTDKNFMVPVGGSIVIEGKKSHALVPRVNELYPGRASSSPLLDLFITLLSMGKTGFLRLLEEREELYVYMKTKMSEVARQYGERVLETPGNPISLAMTVSLRHTTTCSSGATGKANDNKGEETGTERLHVCCEGSNQAENNAPSVSSSSEHEAPSSPKALTMLGSMLFSRNVSGTRVIAQGENKTVCGMKLQGFGASHDRYPVSYLTAAAAIGTTKQEVELFLDRLSKCLHELRTQMCN
eukprot:jgi/Chlat1/8769/Chrsp90S09246